MTKQKIVCDGNGFLNNPFAALSKSSPISSDDEKNSVVSTPEKMPPSLPQYQSARLERAHRSGKTVTVIAFRGNPSDAEKRAWLKQTQKMLGVGGALDGENVILQGDQRDRLRDWH